jgi:hypothetical protein
MSRNRVLLEKLIFTQSGNFPLFTGLEVSLSCSQKPASDPYLGPDAFNPQSSHPIPLRSILILYSNLRLGLPNGLFPSFFRPKFFMYFSSHLFHACHMAIPSHLFDHNNNNNNNNNEH